MLLIILTIALGAFISGIFVSYDMRREINTLTTANLRTSALVIATLLDPGWADSDSGIPMRQPNLERWSGILGVRITIIGTDGVVLADSSVSRSSLKILANHGDRPEVRAALSSGSGMDMRYSETTSEPYLYYALFDRTEGGNGYVIRCSLPMARYYFLVSRVRSSIIVSLIVAGITALVVGVIGARRVTRPIAMLIAASRASKEGERAAYPVGGTAEIEELSRTLKESAQTQARMMSDLRNERNELETIVQSAPCGLMLMDSDGTISCVNAALAPLLRESPDAAAGRSADGELRSPELMDLIASGRDGRSSETCFTFRHDGEERFYKARVIPTGTGELLVVLDDETERMRMEMARKSFVADAGHEFQTPLTSISAAAELLMAMDNSTADERAPYLTEIMRQRERMTSLVDDLLLLSRLESGVPTCESESFDLAQLCLEYIDDAKKRPQASDIEWSVSLPVGEVMFFGRRREIGRSISNLLDNAVKYTYKRYGENPGKSDKKGRISVSLDTDGMECVLHINDNGIGIPRNKLAGIFGRFERAELDRSRSEKSSGGYGLGLAIAKTAIESHGGRIDAESSADSTDFFVHLPITAEDSATTSGNRG
jgi:two-component system phosphate regulon sensor histidine kinase PhoR